MKKRLFRCVLVVALCCISFEHSNTGFTNAAYKDPGAQWTKLQARIDALERRIGKAEDFIALSNLEDAYGYYVDNASGIRLQTFLPGMAGSRLPDAACT
jgi:hypothetical protein